MTSDEAWTVLRAAAGIPINDAADLATVIRAARGAAHPDRHGGDRRAWDHVEQAVLVLTHPGVTSHVRAVGQ